MHCFSFRRSEKMYENETEKKQSITETVLLTHTTNPMLALKVDHS